ncbi:MAG TPA: c-type cytochrome [Chitinophagaceae bacterium]
MKAFPIKLPAIILAISSITVLAMSNCGQSDKSKKTDVVTDSIKKEVETPVVTTDSPVIAPVTPVTVDKPANTEPAVNTDTKKDIAPAANTKAPEPVKKPTVVQPVVTTTKPVTNTNVTPPVDKPVVPPKETPVVKVPEPAKPTPVTPPKVEEVPKPVVVVDKPQPPQNNWIVPAKYQTMKSPYATDKAAYDLGQTVYGTHCKSCHGSKGDGKGPKASQLDTEIGSFLSASFRAQKPGEIYYKTVFGRKDMPKFENKISDDEERWAVVYYIMNLK